ncbi:hypothetical protein KA075_00090 [Candidatus Saccharibacteria bacterium]|jgi:hypothetical protein|nr:hypothetical protein [Candidatus Saccharibacteria bacterium]
MNHSERVTYTGPDNVAEVDGDIVSRDGRSVNVDYQGTSSPPLQNVGEAGLNRAREALSGMDERAKARVQQRRAALSEAAEAAIKLDPPPVRSRRRLR